MVYDQLVYPSAISKCERFFDGLKTIVVYRDPRDQFISFCRTLKVFVPTQAAKFCKLYLANMKTIDKTPNTLVLRFEDFVVHHDEYSKQVNDFLGLDEEEHMLKGNIFRRHESIKRIQKWKTFENQEAIKYIENNIGEYCYNHEYTLE